MVIAREIGRSLEQVRARGAVKLRYADPIHHPQISLLDQIRRVLTRGSEPPYVAQQRPAVAIEKQGQKRSLSRVGGVRNGLFWLRVSRFQHGPAAQSSGSRPVGTLHIYARTGTTRQFAGG